MLEFGNLRGLGNYLKREFVPLSCFFVKGKIRNTEWGVNEEMYIGIRFCPEV
jgi:hypothetical protein